MQSCSHPIRGLLGLDPDIATGRQKVRACSSPEHQGCLVAPEPEQSFLGPLLRYLPTSLSSTTLRPVLQQCVPGRCPPPRRVPSGTACGEAPADHRCRAFAVCCCTLLAGPWTLAGGRLKQEAVALLPFSPQCLLPLLGFPWLSGLLRLLEPFFENLCALRTWLPGLVQLLWLGLLRGLFWVELATPL